MFWQVILHFLFEKLQSGIGTAVFLSLTASVTVMLCELETERIFCCRLLQTCVLPNSVCEDFNHFSADEVGVVCIVCSVWQDWKRAVVLSSFGSSSSWLHSTSALHLVHRRRQILGFCHASFFSACRVGSRLS